MEEIRLALEAFEGQTGAVSRGAAAAAMYRMATEKLTGCLVKGLATVHEQALVGDYILAAMEKPGGWMI